MVPRRHPPESRSADVKLHRDAEIAPEKLRDYVLSPTHPDGRSKAAFLSGVGYLQSDWVRLESDIREQLLPLEATAGKQSPYGQKYEILGQLIGPNGGSVWVRTVWMVPAEGARPRLVTLIPEEAP